MRGKQLAYQDRVKYLGITLDKRLTWSKHVNEHINKCSYLLNKMSRIVSRELGFTPAKIKWVYTAIIKPKLFYGSVVWAYALKPSSNKKLEKNAKKGINSYD